MNFSGLFLFCKGFLKPCAYAYRSFLIPMAGSPIFSFVVDGVEGSSACKPYSPGDEYWSPEADKIGYYDSEERAEFYLKHESSLPVTYDCVFQFEETMDQRIVEIRRSRYDLLAMKYKGICRLYGDLCIVGRTALNRLNGYDGLLEDLPPFVNSVLQSLLWSMLDVRGMFEVWEAMKSTNERAPIDDFNTLHRRMDQLELMVMSCPHEAESSVPRRYRKYFEMQNTSLSALIHPVYTAYLNDFQRVRDICGVLRNPPDNLKEVQGQLEVHIVEMEAQMARFPTFNGMVHPS